MEQNQSAPNVYACISAVAKEIARTGISKDRKNEQQHYKFRGIDDVYNALAPMLAQHGLIILPRCLSREYVERQTQKGGTLFYVTVSAEFDFISAHDGSTHVVGPMYGEAMDSGDKATNKAMSAAYKYAAFQAFCIPTEGDNDADSTTHADTMPAPPQGYDAWWDDMVAVADNGTGALREAWKQSPAALREYTTLHRTKAWDALKAKAETVKEQETVGA